jgi:hypothetical protein
MTRLVVETSGRTIELAPGEELTFGRDPSCHVRLDASDVGISRVAGRVALDGHTWTVENCSRKRVLHVVDETGFTVPLPVAAGDGINRRVVDQQVLTVLVAGERMTHALVLRLAEPLEPAPAITPPVDPVSTRGQAPELTNPQREVLVVMAQGYLRPYPDYDPRPLTYQQVADILGLTKRQVTRRLERVRDELVAAHMAGLEGENDARRPLCEWLLAMRVLTPADLEWLQQRRHRAAVTRVLPKPDRSAIPKAVRGRSFPTTTHPVQDAIERIAERTARQVAPALQQRLKGEYGERWLHVVSERLRREKLPPGHGLRDYRFCLALLAHDPATDGWVPNECRDSARHLNRIANYAAHRRKLTPADVDRAGAYASAIAKHFPPVAAHK